MARPRPAVPDGAGNTRVILTHGRVMAPNTLTNSALALTEDSCADPIHIKGKSISDTITYEKKVHSAKEKAERKLKQSPYKWEIVWRNVAIFSVLHSFGIYGMYLWIFKLCWSTFIFTLMYSYFAGFGITAGAHRLWSHRAYKANFGLRLFLMLGNSAALQNSIHEWARDHRVHHKFTDSDADPHNSTRGFFFSHVGWLLVKKHKYVKEKGRTVDMSDVYADPLVRFQMRYYLPLAIFWTFTLPTLVPWYFWNENLWDSLCVCLFRYTAILNSTWLINSAAHMYGTKPYDKNIYPTENRVLAVLTYGEGWHNYHHVFPWDYKAAELGNYRFNITTAFLDLMAKFGWASELKKVSEEMIRKRVLRTGDGSHPASFGNDHDHGDQLWGWGDTDMNEEEKEDVKKANTLS